VPADVAPGLAVVRIQSTGGPALPIAIEILPAPPVIAAIYGKDGAQINGGRAARPGEMLTLVVSNLDPAVTAAQIGVTVGGNSHPAQNVAPVEVAPGYYVIEFFLGTTLGESNEAPVRVIVNGRRSAPVAIGVAASN
jgi:hypothetical protein